MQKSSTHRRITLSLAIAVVVGALTGIPAQGATWSDIASDSFGRTVSSGWGSADKGGAWTTSISGSAAVSVSGGTGLVSNLAVGNRVVSTLPVTATDVHVISKVAYSGSADNDVFYGWRLRQSSDGGTYYALTYRSNPTGSITLGLSRVASGSSTWLAGVKVSPRLQSGSQHTLEVEFEGSTLRARIWTSNSSAPGWQLTATDDSSSKLNAGRVALDSFINAGSGKSTLHHDDVQVQQSPAPSTPTPTPTPTPTSTPTAPKRGTTLGSQAYAAPSGAVYVDASKGSDSASGSVSAPFKTVAKAVAAAPAGGTVVLRAGSYHESITIEKKLTIQNYQNEVAWLDGSKVVSNWTKSGSAWVATGWTASFSNNMGGDSSFYGRFLLASHSMARYPDQVFVNGIQLAQVDSASSVSSGKFYVDYAADKLYIGSDPSGKEVRGSDLAKAIQINVSGVTLQGFGIRRYATPYESRGTVSTDASGGTFRHLVVTDNATIGLALSGADKIIDHVQVERNGMMGLGSHKANNLRLTDSVISNNNTEHFKFAPVAGGVKITQSSNVVIKSNTVSNNAEGMGIWLDMYNSNFTIVNNTAQDNGAVQIEVEISSGGIVANNTATGGETGINLYNTDQAKVFNNHLGSSSLFGIKLAQDARWKTLAISGFTLKVKNIMIANNVFGCGKTFQFYARDGESNISADAMALTFQGNLFSKRVDTSKPTMVGWGLGDNTSVTRYESPSALAMAKNSSWKNAQTEGCTPIDSLGPQIEANQSVAYPLPSDVASAIGVSSGHKRVGLI